MRYWSEACAPSSTRLIGRLEQFLAAVLTGILAFSLVAVPLGMIGWFRPSLVIPAALLLWAVLWVVWTRGGGELSVQHYRRGPLVIVLLDVLVVTGLNVRYSSQHLLTERDPGVYITTAKWMAKEGSILVD